MLLIEAGPDYPDFDDIPDEVKYGYGHTDQPWRRPHSDHRWTFVVRYTDEAMPGLVPRGRVVGGSSAINGQIFLRGVPDDYDNWATWGNDKWSFEELMPYFRMVETDTDYAGDFHGSEGPIVVRRFKPDEWNPDQRAFYEAARANGFPECPDHNAPDSTGVGPTPLNNPGRVRWSTAIGYLSIARERPNLTIQPEYLVHKVLFKGNRAVGIRGEVDGEVFDYEGEKIILSGGCDWFATSSDAVRCGADGEIGDSRRAGTARPSGRGREPPRSSSGQDGMADARRLRAAGWRGGNAGNPEVHRGEARICLTTCSSKRSRAVRSTLSHTRRERATN